MKFKYLNHYKTTMGKHTGYFLEVIITRFFFLSSKETFFCMDADGHWVNITSGKAPSVEYRNQLTRMGEAQQMLEHYNNTKPKVVFAITSSQNKSLN